MALHYRKRAEVCTAQAGRIDDSDHAGVGRWNISGTDKYRHTQAEDGEQKCRPRRSTTQHSMTTSRLTASEPKTCSTRSLGRRSKLSPSRASTPACSFSSRTAGDAILTFGTTLDPDDDEWDRVAEIVSGVVRQSVGLDRHAMPRSRVRNHRRLGATVCCRRSHDPMKYRDIATDRFQLPSTHPILATLRIDPADWHRLKNSMPTTRRRVFSAMTNHTMNV